MLSVKENNFQSAVEESAGPVIVEFHASWCVDCRRIESAYNQFPEKYPGAVFAEVDSEVSPALAQRFDVRGIPTLLVFRNGELTDRLYSRDAKTVRQVEEFVEKQLSPSETVR